MYENTNLRCRNCKFWWPKDEGRPDPHLRMHAALGQCRRHPPTLTAVERAWAIVHSDDWCGDHAHISS
jgi:hypothetical protein